MHFLLLMLTLQFGGGTQAKVLTIDTPSHAYTFLFTGEGE